MGIIESAVREFKYELPSSACRYLIINKDLIKNPEKRTRKTIKSKKSLRTNIF